MKTLLIIASCIIVFLVLNYFFPYFSVILVSMVILLYFLLTYNTVSTRRKAGRTIMLLGLQEHDEWIVHDRVWIAIFLILSGFRLIRVMQFSKGIDTLLNELPHLSLYLYIIVMLIGKNKIAEHGILMKTGYLIKWEDVKDWCWKDDESSILVIKSIRVPLIKWKHNDKITTTELKVPFQFKKLISNILFKYIAERGY